MSMDYKELHLIGSSSPHIRTKDGTSHIMAELHTLEEEITAGLKELEEML